MSRANATAQIAANIAARGPDRRRHQRVKVNLLGRFMTESRQEYPCQVINMSPGGAALIAPVIGSVGEKVVAYIDHIGRIEGKIAREIEGGFAISINATARKRDKIASQLTWLANRHELNLPEDRRHDRFTPENPVSNIVLPDGREYRCGVIDVSMSGAAIKTDVKPAIGTVLTLGKMRARVVRHIEEGIAIEFSQVVNEDEIKSGF
ncbi:MAG: PilZ domain-containing protein [Stappiaceae bacterium]